MLELKFIDMPSEYRPGLRLLEEDLGIRPADGGLPVRFAHSEQLQIQWDGSRALIACRERAHFFRGLALFRDALQSRGRAAFSLTETPGFQKVGAMLDASRNAVMRPAAVEALLRKMACMGLNVAMLYTEDTYEVEGYPYFGYRRGRYTAEEIRRIDDTADALGIELVPCIQTLGHLLNVLKWDCMAEYRDTANVLLCDDEKVYRLIEDMIAAASSPVRSHRIHVGMDEAMDLGLGRYLDRNGYENGFSLIRRHLDRVVQICRQRGLSPLIWSDMYFRLASKSRDYYDLEGKIPPEVIEGAPADMGLVYWDYYHTDEKFYQEYIRRHQAFRNPTSFAGGLWTWTSPAVHYGEAFRTSWPALRQCRACGISEVLATMWGDDGTECCPMAALLGLQLYAEACFHDDIEPQRLKEHFRACTGEDAEAFLAISKLDVLEPEAGDGLPPREAGNLSRLLLYADPLLNLFEKDFEGLELAEHYRGLAAELRGYAGQSNSFGLLFEFYADLADFLQDKSNVTAQIRANYDSQNRRGLSSLAEQSLPALRKKADHLRFVWRKLWFAYHKPQGFEVLDLRLGGLAARLDTAAGRILEWLDGDCERLEELEEPCLPFTRFGGGEEPPRFGGVYSWQRMVSASNL